MSSPEEDFMAYDDYPVIGGFVCPVTDCEDPLFVHAQLQVTMMFGEDGTPLMSFGVKLYTDAVALHMVGHGGAPVLYDSMESYFENHPEDEE